MNRLWTWLICVVSYVVLGGLVGVSLDSLMFRISNDYVFNPGELTFKSLHLSFWLGTIYAAGCTLGENHISSLSGLLGALVATSYAFFAGIIVAGIKYSFAKLRSETVLGLAPIPRIAFCEGLVWGVTIGAILGTVVVIYYQRKLAKVVEQTTLLSSTAPNLDE